MKGSLRMHGWYLRGGRYRFAALIVALLGACFLLSTTSASALTTVPTKMNFQGRLTDSSGNVKANGTYNMRLRLYTVSSGGSAVWSEDRLVSASQGVTVTNGLFAIKLGEVTSLPASLFASGELYLSVELASPATATSSSPSWTEGAMTPRNQMATSAYAYNAETLDGLDSADFGQLSVNNVWTGTNTFNVLGTNAFRIQNGSAVDMLNINTSTATMTVSVDTTIAAGKTITVVGDTTANRPGSPAEGMIYFDTTTKKLEIYSNGKWQADRTDAVIVAASNSSQADKDAADYVADGNTAAAADGDQVQINAALTAASGKKVVLLAGTYVADASISVPNNTTLAGVGRGTAIEFGDIDVTDTLIENADTSTGTGVTVRDMYINGRKDLNTGVQRGIRFTGVGGGSGATARNGGRIEGVYATDFNDGFMLTSSKFNTITRSTTTSNDEAGIFVDSGATDNIIDSSVSNGDLYGLYVIEDKTTITNNQINSASSVGIWVDSSDYNTITSNNVTGSADIGIQIGYGNSNVVSSNTVTNSTNQGLYLLGWSSNTLGINNIVSGNVLKDNGGSTTNNGIYVNAADSNTIIGNKITDSSATTTNYAINVSNSTSDTNYLADNTLGTGSINDAGTGTIYAGQVDSSGNLRLQPAGTVELQKNTNVTGTLQATGNITASSGTVTIGTTSVAGNLVISDGSSNTATITIGSLAGNYTYSIPVTTANDTFCLVTLANCADGGVTSVGAYSTSNTAAGGATISGSSIIFQDASTTAPGMVGTGTQTFAGNKTFNGTLSVNDVSLAAGKTITIIGDTTANRPGSPTEGMVYFDTSTKQLLTYSNGKWQADRSTSTKIVAASNSSQAIKDAADYVADGNTAAAADGDQVQINTALTAAAGGKVYLAEGTYTVDDSISMPNNTTLAGAGMGTLITIPDSFNTDINTIANSDISTGTGVTIQDLRLDGNKANQISDTMNGIYLSGMGGGSGATARQGAKVTGTRVSNFNADGIYLANSFNNTLTSNTAQANTNAGFYVASSSYYNTLTSNTAQGNGVHGFYVAGDYSTFTSNTAEGNAQGFYLEGSASNTLTGNNAVNNTSRGFSLLVGSSNNTLTGNTAETNISVGFYLNASTYNTFTGNTVNGSSTSVSLNASSNNNTFTGNTATTGAVGFSLSSSSRNVLTGNNVQAETSAGFQLNSSSNNTISGNKLHDNGNTTANNAILLSGSDSNLITSNSITDTSATTTNYAIDVINSTSDTNYLADNTLGGGTINDIGTGTIYANQVDSSGQSINRTSGGFAIQGTAGTNLLSTAGTASVTIGTSDTTGTVLVLDTKTDAGDPTGILGGMYYNSNTGEFRCYQVSAWKNCDDGGDATTVDGLDSTAFGQLGTSNTWTGTNTFNVLGTSAFRIQNGSAVDVLKVDTVSQTVSVGTSAGTSTARFSVAGVGGSVWTARAAAQANVWNAVTYGNGMYVAVSQSGTNRVMTSPDGVTWTVRSAAQANSWRAVTYGNGLFVAVSTDGTNRVMTSPDGITWTARTAAQANSWASVAYGNGLYVAVAYDGTNRVMTSPDGITWTARTAAEANSWRSITYGNGLFVATSNDGTNQVMTSPDGITWTARAASEANQWLSVTYGDDLFVAVAYTGTNRVMTSPDGITWTARAAAEANSWNEVTYGNGLYVAVSTDGTNRVMTSPDGITWTARAAAEANSWESITYGNGLFVAVAYTGTNRVMTNSDVALSTQGAVQINGDLSTTGILSSTGTVNFTNATNSTSAFAIKNAASVDILKVDTVNQTVSVGNGTNTNNARISIDGTGGSTWIARSAAETNSWQSVAYGNGLFVAVATSGTNRVMTSPDGITWTARAASEANSWQAVTYGNGLFVAVSWSGTNRVMTSPDGITWTARAASEANGWQSVTYGNGLFVAVSSDGTNRVMTSPDGITWTARAASEANSWQAVIYANGMFVAVSSTGTNRVMTSPDGITWTARAAAEANGWNDVTYGNGLFVALAYDGTNRVMTSPDGITWTARAASEANNWNDITYGNGMFVAVSSTGTNRVMISPDGITWTARAAAEAATWLSVTYANDQYVAVGSTGSRVMTSSDVALDVRGQVQVTGDFTVGNGLFSIDNEGAGTVTLFDSTKSGEPGEWKSASNALPAAYYGAMSVTANGYVYSIGGYTGSAVRTTVSYAKLNADGSVSTWASTTALPNGRYWGSAAVYNGHVYVTGGDNSAGGGSPQSTTYYAKLNADGTVGTWRTFAAAIPSTVSTHSTVTYNGYLYVIGGHDGVNALDTVYYMKLSAEGGPLNGSWSTTTVMPQTINSHTSVVANGYLYILGGLNSGTPQDEVQYAKLNADGTVGTWTTATNALSLDVYNASSVVANGYVYSIGGYRSGSSQAVVQYARLGSSGSVGTWSTAANVLPAARALHQSVVANGYVYAMGGSVGGSAQSTVYYSRLGGVLSVGGSLDLVGLMGQDLAEGGDGSSGSAAGSITAGNITAVGTLQIQGAATFAGTASVAGDFSAGNGIFSVETSGTVVRVGSATADSTGVVLVLDTKNTSGDPTGIDGAMYYNSSSKSFRCYMNGAWRSCVSGVVFANTTVPAAITNTASETNFAQNYSIPANDCQPGRVYRVTAQGTYSIPITTNPSITIRVKAGATVLGTTGSQSLGASALTNRQWRVEFQFICVTSGASGTVEAGGLFIRHTSAIASATWEMNNTAPITVDTTSAETLQISAQWSAAAAANTITMRQLIVEESGP